MPVLDRFLKYVTIDTRADDSSTSVPTTPGQLVLIDLLARELRDLGLTDVERDANGYLFATIPSTVDGPCPTVGFIAHVDTSPEMSGKDVQPIVHRDWDGSDIVLPDDRTAILRVADWPELRDQIGHDIVTASGTTLLGGDDKAGVAAIMAAAEYLVTHPSIPHGPIRLGFTPDEEIGRGPNHFDIARFGAVCAYTLDGGAVGELEMESFSADAMVVSFIGFNTHPGYAKGRMVNAIKAAARFIDRLPHDQLSPETTEGHEGFVHPYQMEVSVDRTSVRLIIRDFDTGQLARKEAFVEHIARAVADETGASIETVVQEQYRNMREVLDTRPEIVERARTAIRRAGLEPREKPIRGGTDGSRLSFMGLPTPNLFAGEHNFHSRLEWTSRQDMEKAVEAIVHLAQVWAEER
jgi:tripeptide aminopeptidase